MIFLWPTLNELTRSGERRERNLRDLEQRMDAFLMEKANRACPQIVDRVRRSRADVRREGTRRGNAMPRKQDLAV